MGDDGRRATLPLVRRCVLLVPVALVLAGCGDLDRAGLEHRIASDTNRTIGTEAVEAVRCTRDHSVARASYACTVVPSNGRPPIRVLVAVSGSTYTILRTTPRAARR